jgi:hypothetical protein
MYLLATLMERIGEDLVSGGEDLVSGGEDLVSELN